MIDSIDFAKFIISRVNLLNEEKTEEDKVSLGETKLQKLLYICDGFLLAAKLDLVGENAKAWNFGPVYPRVHTWLEKNPDAFYNQYEFTEDNVGTFNKIVKLIDAVINHFGKWSAGELSNWSHQPGSPWEKALERGKGLMNSVIEKNDMKKYFREYFGDNP